jgi:hypothetical protein
VDRIQTDALPDGILTPDTSTESERVQLRIWREMSTTEKAQAVTDVSTAASELAMAGIRLRHPSATEEECRLRYALLTLGRRLACVAYPEVEELVRS